MTFRRAILRLGGDGLVAADAWAHLEWHYGEPHRSYHNLAHAKAVDRESAQLARTVGLGFIDVAIVSVAAWTHDVIYQAQPGEDEQRSAEWTRLWMTRAGISPERTARVESLVLATIGHDAPADDLLATALLDADLSILGASPGDYETYAAAVRQEYSSLTDADWANGRAAVLERLLARDPLYRSAPARELWDAAARRNLAAELTRWRTPRDDR